MLAFVVQVILVKQYDMHESGIDKNSECFKDL